MRRPIYINRAGARRKGCRRGWASAEIVWSTVGGGWFADNIIQRSERIGDNLSSSGWSWGGK